LGGPKKAWARKKKKKKKGGKIKGEKRRRGAENFLNKIGGPLRGGWPPPPPPPPRWFWRAEQKTPGENPSLVFAEIQGKRALRSICGLSIHFQICWGRGGPGRGPPPPPRKRAQHFGPGPKRVFFSPAFGVGRGCGWAGGEQARRKKKKTKTWDPKAGSLPFNNQEGIFG